MPSPNFATHPITVPLLLLLLAAHMTCRESSSSSLRSPRQPRLVCSPSTSAKSFVLRNECFDGFVTVAHGKPVAQHKGLDEHSPEVEIRKETCRDSRSGLMDPVMSRIFHKQSGKYICFNRHGKLRAMTPRRANKVGRLCAFVELPAQPTYVHLRSAFDQRWLLGFNGRVRRLIHADDGSAAAPPLAMAKNRDVDENACDFLFATAEYRGSDWRDDWSGLMGRPSSHDF